MCYSTMSNYYSWLISLFGSIGLLILGILKKDYNYFWLSGFALTFTQIQVIEIILWSNIENNNIKNAKNMAKYIPLLLWLQPFINSLLGYIVTKNKYLLYSTLVFGLLLSIDSHNSFYNSDFDLKIGKNNHLVWIRDNNNKILSNYLFASLYLIGLVMPFLFLENKSLKTMILVYYALSILFLNVKYESDEVNSVWCFVSVTLIYLLLFVGLFN